MQVFYIVNWPYHEHREMPKSRIRWVRAKVDFGGAGWYTLSQHADATAALCTWEIVRGMAALSPFRGLILTDCGDVQPMNVDTIAALSRWKVSEIERGLSVLVNVLKWVGVTEFDAHPATISRRLWKEVFATQGLAGAKSPRRRRDGSAKSAGSLRGEIAPTLRDVKGRDDTGEREKHARETGHETPPLPPSASPETAKSGTEATARPAEPQAGAGQRPPASVAPVAQQKPVDGGAVGQAAIAYPADATPAEILCAERTGWGVTPWEPVRNAVAQLVQLSKTCAAWTPDDYTSAGLRGIMDRNGYVMSFLSEKATPETKPNNGKITAAFRQWHMDRVQRRARSMEAAQAPKPTPVDQPRPSLTAMMSARTVWRQKCRDAGVNPDLPGAEEKVPFERPAAESGKVGAA